jgi:hypothetical protein
MGTAYSLRTVPKKEVKSLPRRKIIKPKNIGEIITEMGAIYYDARRNQLDTLDASRLTSVLTALRQCIEVSDIEDRLIALEDKVEK